MRRPTTPRRTRARACRTRRGFPKRGARPRSLPATTGSGRTAATGSTRAPPRRRKSATTRSAGCRGKSARPRRLVKGGVGGRGARAIRACGARARRARGAVRRVAPRPPPPAPPPPPRTVRVVHLRREADLWRLVRVVLGELEHEAKRAALPRRVVRPENDRLPHHDVLLERRRVDARRRVRRHALKVAHEALPRRRGHGGAPRRWRGEGAAAAAAAGAAGRRARGPPEQHTTRRVERRGARCARAAAAARAATPAVAG